MTEFFPDTTELSQMVFPMLQNPVWLIWGCPKKYLSVRMSQGDFSGHENFLVAISSLSCRYGYGRTFKDMDWPYFQQKPLERFVFILKLLGDFWQYLGNVKNTTSENRR